MPDTQGALTLENLAHGAAIELVNAELEKVAANLDDVNADRAATREITLKLKFKPHKGRDKVDVDMVCTAKLASVNPQRTLAYLGRTAKGAAVLVEEDPRQLKLFKGAGGQVLDMPNRTGGQS